MHYATPDALAHAQPLASLPDPALDPLWREHGFHLGRAGTMLLVGTVLVAGLLAHLLGFAAAAG